MRRISSWILPILTVGCLALFPWVIQAQQEIQKPGMQEPLVESSVEVAPKHISYRVKIGPYSTNGTLDAAHPATAFELGSSTLLVSADFSEPRPVIRYEVIGRGATKGTLIVPLGTYTNRFDRLESKEADGVELEKEPTFDADVYSHLRVAPLQVSWWTQLFGARDRGSMTPLKPVSSLDVCVMDGEFHTLWVANGVTLSYDFTGLMETKGERFLPYGLYTITFKRPTQVR